MLDAVEYLVVSAECVLGTALVVGAIVTSVAIILPNLMRPPHRQGTVTACKSNLKNIGTACEMYSTDNSAYYPRTMNALTPNYLRTIPTCASAGEDTYSEGFVAHNDRQAQAYTVVCRGNHHSGVNLGPNYPQYTSVQGLISM
jgi:hypothetical protein